jgi:predicted sulfurtransferase
MDYLFCGVVEVQGVQDQLGTPCGRSARTLCYDCGTSLCPAHAEQCDLCKETFCQSCMSFHQSEHPIPAQRNLSGPQKRKSA